MLKSVCDCRLCMREGEGLQRAHGLRARPRERVSEIVEPMNEQRASKETKLSFGLVVVTLRFRRAVSIRTTRQQARNSSSDSTRRCRSLTEHSSWQAVLTNSTRAFCSRREGLDGRAGKGVIVDPGAHAGRALGCPQRMSSQLSLISFHLFECNLHGTLPADSDQY
jgi:hypothetical protein